MHLLCPIENAPFNMDEIDIYPFPSLDHAEAWTKLNGTSLSRRQVQEDLKLKHDGLLAAFQALKNEDDSSRVQLNSARIINAVDDWYPLISPQTVRINKQCLAYVGLGVKGHTMSRTLIPTIA